MVLLNSGAPLSQRLLFSAFALLLLMGSFLLPVSFLLLFTVLSIRSLSISQVDQCGCITESFFVM